ncbi:hypothetical protein [Nonomuraea sp. NPDC048916]|uniref:hypothetical protein n=1 Tax=Nonomuraea sp. NPDC048916 TaxID=3154232 RepID=UPI0034092F1E
MALAEEPSTAELEQFFRLDRAAPREMKVGDLVDHAPPGEGRQVRHDDRPRSFAWPA